ncbi:MAG: SH3 domain-containing protein [Chloroflexi bacterium]|nr:SH3 domain-containing protein [Chloroflexota bacterium]
MKHRFLLLSACLVSASLLTACGADHPPPTPDAAATEAVIAAKIFATLNAAAPTPAPTATVPPATTTLPAPTTVAPSPTPVAPTLTPTASPAPTLTATQQPSPTAISEGPLASMLSATLNVRAGPGTGHAVIATAKQGERLPVTGRNLDGSWLEVMLPEGRSGWISASLAQLNVPAGTVAAARTIPTPPPAPTAAPAAEKPAAGKRDLEVTFVNPHYDCQQMEWFYTGDDNDSHPLWGYRAFQVDLYIKNNSPTPIEPPWRPRRWIITDGQTDVVNGIVWQWVNRNTGYYPQPVIQPGQGAGWTFLAFPIDRHQWVKAVEFVWNDQVYRQEFDLGQFGNAHNYQDCGFIKSHTERPTPTPRP